MKKQFEKREKEILQGLLSMLASKAQSEKMKKEYKYTRKLWDKFIGENLEMNLKPEEVGTIKMLMKEVIKESERPVKEGEIPAMMEADLTTCKNLLTRLEA